jgi:hypothetical protein
MGCFSVVLAVLARALSVISRHFWTNESSNVGDIFTSEPNTWTGSAERLHNFADDASSWVGFDQYSHIATALQLVSSRQLLFQQIAACKCLKVLRPESLNLALQDVLKSSTKSHLTALHEIIYCSTVSWWI